MKLETYIATLKHDSGKIRLKVVTLNGKQGAKRQVMAMEGCPERSIIEIKKINKRSLNRAIY